MGYYCKIVHEDSSDYMVATAPVGNIVELYPRSQTEAYISFTYSYATIIDKVLAGGIDGHSIIENIDMNFTSEP